MSDHTEQRKLAAIMFTDMVGYSALAQEHEAVALELLEEHRRLLRSLFPSFNGAEIKTIGDAFLVEFGSALEAAQCAIEIQRTLAHRNTDVPAEKRIQVRIGIHIGDVVHRGGDVYGDGVNIASRIEQLAGPSGICISMDVERQIRHALEASLVKLPPAELKNIQVPMELFRIVLPWEKAGPTGSASGTTEPRETKKLLATVVVVLLVVAVLGSAGWWFSHRSGSSTTPAGTGPALAAPAKSVAVLPFVNLSADKADEYLSDGMTEELLNTLTKVKVLHVPGRSSSFAFKGKNEEGIFRKVGEQLHVGAVLEGSVRKAGDKLRITAQLINVADGFHLWSDTYDRDMTNIFAIQSEVAQQVVAALKVQLGVEETHALGKKPTENLEAYKLYLQGRYQWNRRTGESIKQAIEYFNQAIAKDPSYALAYAGLADCYVVLSEYSSLPTRETYPKARAAASKALELDSSLAEPRAALAQVKADLDWDWSGAEAEFRRAIALNPNYATAHHWLALLLRDMRRYDEALGEIKLAQELDPLSPVINLNVGDMLSYIGRTDLGIEVLKKQITLDPSFVGAHNILGWHYFMQGRLPEATAEFETGHRLEGSGIYGLGSLGVAYARAGRTNDAQKNLRQLLEAQRQGFDYLLDIACVQLALGDDQAALNSLEKAFAEHAYGLQALNYDLFWNELRPHPRVQAILRKMNLVK